MAPNRRTYLNDVGDMAKSRFVRKQITKAEFAARVYKLMIGKGWSQSELARQSGLTRAVISDYVRGVNMPEPKYLEKLAEALGIAPSDLLPNYDQQAIDLEENPALEIRTSAEDPSRTWIRVNREIETSRLAHVIQAIEEAAPVAARKGK